jgi:hypothetical protein
MKYFVLILILVISTLVFGMLDQRVLNQQKEIVTLELIAPDGQKTTVKSIVGGEPVTITDKNSETWTIYVKAVEASK